MDSRDIMIYFIVNITARTGKSRAIWMEMKETKQGEVWIQVKNKIRPGKKIDFHTEKKKKE